MVTPGDAPPEDEMSTKYRVNANASKVSVTATSNLHDVKGSCPGLSGELFGNLSDLVKTGGGALKLDVRRFGSGDRIRDFAMRTHIDVAKHPEAEVPEIKILSVEEQGGAKKVLFEATLKYRFKTPKVHGEAIVKEEGGRLSVDATFPLTLRDVNVEPPKFLFLKVGEVVKVEVHLEALPA
jgi:hypothetical protein